MRTSSELFTEIACRNDVRREAGLPLLDMRATIAEEHHRDRMMAFRDAAHRHRADHDRIKADVMNELRRRYGLGFGMSAGGRWAVDVVAERRFTRWLRGRGIVVPDDRTAIGYGSGKAGQSD